MNPIVFASPAVSHPSRRITPFGHALVAALALAALLAASPRGAAAAPKPETGWEFVTSSGGVVPVGAQRQSSGSGALSAAQLSRVVSPVLAITATAGWARSHDFESSARPALDIVNADLGAELRGARRTAGGLAFRPFVELGAGARRYDPRGAAGAAYRGAAFGGAGGELGVRRVRVRLDARDYVTARRPAGGGAAAARHELALMAGVRWVAR